MPDQDQEKPQRIEVVKEVNVAIRVRRQKWEYTIATVPTRPEGRKLENLDVLGPQGWEAVCMVGDDLLLKRPTE